MVVVEIFNLLGVDVAIVNVFLLLRLILLSLLNYHLVLALDEERILLVEIDLEQLHELQLVHFPRQRVLVFKLSGDSVMPLLKQVIPQVLADRYLVALRE